MTVNIEQIKNDQAGNRVWTCIRDTRHGPLEIGQVVMDKDGPRFWNKLPWLSIDEIDDLVEIQKFMRKFMCAKSWERYRNPDPRCTYPFTPDPVGYCWGYAQAVDQKVSQAEIILTCFICECWKAETPEAASGKEMEVKP